MKRRETEDHLAIFKQKLINDLRIFEAQGVTMDADYNYTAVVEAFEVEQTDLMFWEDTDTKSVTQVLEYLDEKGVFSWQNAVMNHRLALQLNVKSFIIIYTAQKFRIWEYRAGGVTAGALMATGTKVPSASAEYFDENQFADWWASLKKTQQRKPLKNGGAGRQNMTEIDKILLRHGLMWGGNVDGYILDGTGKVKLIIDFISDSATNTKKDFIDWANPNTWFDDNPKHGPKFEGWSATMGVAETLRIPHLIAYLPKKGPKEWAVIIETSQLEKKGIKVRSKTGLQIDHGFANDFYEGADAAKTRIMDILTNGSSPKILRD